MKILVIFSVVFCTSFAEARQYIQCSQVDSDSTDRTVINLDGDRSTLFMTTGADDPDELRILKSIQLISSDTNETIFQSSDAYSIETVKIPTEFIGQASNRVTASLSLQAVDGSIRADVDMLCFSAIYLP